MQSPEKPVEHLSRGELRSITPESIESYFDKKIESVRVLFADSKEDPITIPDGWHGAGKQGEALVKVGDMLTEPMAGTELSAKDFIPWMLAKGFTISTTGSKAIQFMKGDTEGSLRFTRNDSGKTPIEIQMYHGGTSVKLQTLAYIGNKKTEDITDDYREVYTRSVRSLFSPFISKGTKGARDRLGLSGSVDILRRIDDCLASGVTISGDQIIDDIMRAPKEHLVEVIDVSVATTQAIVVSIAMAEYRNVPLIMRIGAPTFGLGNGDRLNYMVNTLPKMKKYGPLAVGDMGKLMDAGDSATAKPEIHPLGEGEDLREVRLFLGGGVPVLRIMADEYTSRGKPYKWHTLLRRASRVNFGLKEWGVLMSGTDLIVRPARRDSLFLKPRKKNDPDAEPTIMIDHEMPGFVDPPGLWVSLGKTEGGFREAYFIDRGVRRTIYIPIPESE